MYFISSILRVLKEGGGQKLHFWSVCHLSLSQELAPFLSAYKTSFGTLHAHDALPRPLTQHINNSHAEH